jgi:TP901 family phage tail tape measure protein
MAKVKAVANANSKEFEIMRKEAEKLGASTRYSAYEAASALENLTRNGLDARKAAKALASVLELAGANAIELAEAADIVTNTMNMFGLSVDKLNRVNDVLSKTTASSATNITDLYEALKYAAPTANLFGINIEEVNAALATLANIGVKGSQAGTTLRSILNSLVNPSAEAAAEMKKYGLSINETSIKTDGLLSTLEKLKNADLSAASSGTIFGKMFGGYAQSLINNNDLTSQLKSQLDNATGEAARMFKEGAGSFNVAIDNFTSTFESAMIKAFDAVKPVLTNVVNGFTDFISALTDLPTVATAAFSIIGGKGVSEFKKIYDEISATNRAIQEKEELLKNVKGGFNFGDLIIHYKEYSFNELNLPSLIQQINESEQATSKLKKAFNSIDVKSLDNAYNAFAAINELLHRFDLDDLKVDLNDALLDEDRLNHYLDNLKRIPSILNEEIRDGNYFGLPTEEQARKKAAEYTKEIQIELSKIKPDAVKKLAAAFVLLNEEIENTPKQVKPV